MEPSKAHARIYAVAMKAEKTEPRSVSEDEIFEAPGARETRQFA
jgi:hypothetical protein